MADTLAKQPSLSSVEQVKTQISGTKEEGFTKEEIDGIKPGLAQLSEADINEVYAYLQQQVTDATTLGLQELEEVILDWLQDGYEDLQEVFKEDENMKFMFDIISAHIDWQLVEAGIKTPEYSTVALDSIKLVLFNRLQVLFSTEWYIGSQVQGAVETIFWPFRDVDTKTSSLETLGNIFSDIKAKISSDPKYQTKIQDLFTTTLWDATQLIMEAKKQQIDLEDTGVVTLVVDGKLKEAKEYVGWKSQREYYDEVLATTKKIAESKGDAMKQAEDIKMVIESLPFGIGEGIMDFMGSLTQEHPFIGFIFAFLFGPEFLDTFLSTEWIKRKESISHLMKYCKEEWSALSWLAESLGKDFDAEKLIGFFDFLKAKKIEGFEEEGFWEAIITGKGDNKSWKEIHTLLRYGKNEGESLFLKKDFDNWWTGFINRLNKIAEIEREKQEAELKIQQEADDTAKHFDDEAALALWSLVLPPTEPAPLDVALPNSQHSVAVPEVGVAPSPVSSMDTQHWQGLDESSSQDGVSVVSDTPAQLEVELSGVTLLVFFSEQFNISKYQWVDLKGKDLLEKREVLMGLYHSSEYKSIFSGINTFGEMRDNIWLLQEKRQKIAQNREEERQEREFQASVMTAKIPGEIMYKWERVTVNVRGNCIILWTAPQSVFMCKVMYDGKDILEWIEFKSGKLTIVTKVGGWFMGLWKLETPVSTDDLITTLKTLLAGDNVIKSQWESSLQIIKTS